MRAAYGKECRELFTVPEGRSLVGADLSGIELRCLAHFLPDGGEYGRELINGDIHQINADKMGISRERMKTVQYAMLYGSGDARLGHILGKGAKEGRELKAAYFAANPAFGVLMRQVKDALKRRGHLLALDGGKLTVRSEHGALNVLLQSAGALIAKKWVQLMDQEIKHQNLDAEIIAFVHDEIQVSVTSKEGVPDHVGLLARRMAEEAGRHFKFRIPVEAEYSIGRTWADTH